MAVTHHYRPSRKFWLPGHARHARESGKKRLWSCQFVKWRQLEFQDRLFDPFIVLVAIDSQGDRKIGMPQRLGDELGVDPFVEPGLRRPVAKSMQVVLATDVGLRRQALDQLPDAVIGQGMALHVEPESIRRIDRALIERVANRLLAGLAQKDLASPALPKHPGSVVLHIELRDRPADQLAGPQAGCCHDREDRKVPQTRAPGRRPDRPQVFDGDGLHLHRTGILGTRQMVKEIHLDQALAHHLVPEGARGPQMVA